MEIDVIDRVLKFQEGMHFTKTLELVSDTDFKTRNFVRRFIDYCFGKFSEKAIAKTINNFYKTTSNIKAKDIYEGHVEQLKLVNKILSGKIKSSVDKIEAWFNFYRARAENRAIEKAHLLFQKKEEQKEIELPVINRCVSSQPLKIMIPVKELSTPPLKERQKPVYGTRDVKNRIAKVEKFKGFNELMLLGVLMDVKKDPEKCVLFLDRVVGLQTFKALLKKTPGPLFLSPEDMRLERDIDHVITLYQARELKCAREKTQSHEAKSMNKREEETPSKENASNPPLEKANQQIEQITNGAFKTSKSILSTASNATKNAALNAFRALVPKEKYTPLAKAILNNEDDIELETLPTYKIQTIE